MNDDRINAFTEEVSQLKLRGANADRERLLFVVGCVALVGGVIVAVLGGIQASGTTRAADQWAAIATGSLVGLALVILGAALFVRYSLSRFMRFWLVRLVHEQRSETDRLIEAIQNLRRPD
jgi:uncharacterized membrane protein YhiD involved in acid resistance